MSSVYRIVGDHLEPVPGVVLIGVHSLDECAHRPCVVHAPSNHRLRSWPLVWRQDRAMFERLCVHGVGHPDPDHLAHLSLVLAPEEAAAESVHGRCGCCTTAGDPT